MLSASLPRVRDDRQHSLSLITHSWQKTHSRPKRFARSSPLPGTVSAGVKPTLNDGARLSESFKNKGAAQAPLSAVAHKGRVRAAARRDGHLRPPVRASISPAPPSRARRRVPRQSSAARRPGREKRESPEQTDRAPSATGEAPRASDARWMDRGRPPHRVRLREPARDSLPPANVAASRCPWICRASESSTTSPRTRRSARAAARPCIGWARKSASNCTWRSRYRCCNTRVSSTRADTASVTACARRSWSRRCRRSLCRAVTEGEWPQRAGHVVYLGLSKRRG